MARRKSVDKFRVGQLVTFVLDESSQWERANGELGVVTCPNVYGAWTCSNLDGNGPRGTQTGYRYSVRWNGGVHNFDEDMLRAIYEGETVSTWERFAKITSIDIATPRSAKAEAGHG